MIPGPVNRLPAGDTGPAGTVRPRRIFCAGTMSYCLDTAAHKA